MTTSLDVTSSHELVPGDLFREDRLHRTVYTEPRVFEAEMDRVFGRTWLYVGHESEIDKPGDYKTTFMGLHPVIVSRSEGGGIHVLYNRCTHRAATVCQYDSGNSSFFRCDYHGWTFRNDGTLIGQTFSSGYDPRDCDRAEFNRLRDQHEKTSGSGACWRGWSMRWASSRRISVTSSRSGRSRSSSPSCARSSPPA